MIGMNPSLRFIWILVALFFFFLALFFLSGVYLIKKGHELLLVKKRGYSKTLGPGLYFYLPILYEGFQFLESGNVQHLHCHKQHITITGELKDPDAFISHKKSLKTISKTAFKDHEDREAISLQIRDELNQNGWEIQAVTIEQ
jgi:hypothetical protein